MHFAACRAPRRRPSDRVAGCGSTRVSSPLRVRNFEPVLHLCCFLIAIDSRRYPLLYVTWLDPIRPDKSFYQEMPCGIAQLVQCPSITCPTRRGYADHHGFKCYSASCRQRNQGNGYAAETHSPKVEELADIRKLVSDSPASSAPAPAPVQAVKAPSRLRIALSASELDNESKPRTEPMSAIAETDAAIKSEPHPSGGQSHPSDTQMHPSLEASEAPDQNGPEVAPMDMDVSQPVPAEEEVKVEPEPMIEPRDERVTPSISPEGTVKFVSTIQGLQSTAFAQPLSAMTSESASRMSSASHRGQGPTSVSQSGSSAWVSADAVAHPPASATTDADGSPALRQDSDSGAMEVESQGSVADDSRSPPRSPPLRQFEAPSDLTLPYQMQPGFALRRETDTRFSRDSVDSEGTVTGDESANDGDTVTDGDTGAEDTDDQYWDSRQHPASRPHPDETEYDSAGSGFSVASGSVVVSRYGSPAASGDPDTGSSRSRKRKRTNTKPENLTKAEMEAKYGKRAIMCTCGRVFSNGQALGGHRGKCKVPRERAKALAAGARMDSDTDEPGRPPKKPRSRPKPEPEDKAERDRQKAEARERKAREKAAAKQAAREAKLRERAATRVERGEERDMEVEAPRPQKSRRRPPIAVINPVQPKIRPVFPIRPFHPDDYKLGRNERRPQVPAAVIKIHPFIFPDLPPNFFGIHRDFAKHKHNLSKLDELNPNTDAQLYGPVDEPELDSNQGFLEFGREAPRKLAFVAPGIKMRDDAKTHLGRTRSQTPNSDIGDAGGEKS